MNLSSNSTRPSRLADYFLVVGASETKPFYDGRYVLKGPRISDLELVYPPTDYKDMKPPVQGEAFFPLGLNLRQSSKREEFYYFVHTDEKRRQSYGYCLVFYQKAQDSFLNGVIKALRTIYGAVHDNADEPSSRSSNSFSSADRIDSLKNRKNVIDCIDRLAKYQNPGDLSRPGMTKQKGLKKFSPNTSPSSSRLLSSPSISQEQSSYYIPRCICIMSRWPFFLQFRQLLKNIYQLVLSEGPFTLPIERWVQCICSFNAFPPTLSGFNASLVEQVVVMDITKHDARGVEAVHVDEAVMMPESDIKKHPLTIHQVPFLCPPANEPLGWKFLPFRPVLDALSHRTIMIIYECMLVERKILFVSSQLSLLSTAGDFFTSLLYPLEWHHTYIPILPSEVLLALESPSPYIAGIHSSSVRSLEEQKTISRSNNNNADDDDTVVLVSSCLETIEEKIDLDYDPLRDRASMIDDHITRLISRSRPNHSHDGLPAVFTDIVTVVGDGQEISPDVVQVFLDHDMIVIGRLDGVVKKSRKPNVLVKLDSFVKSAVLPSFSVLKGLLPSEVNCSEFLPDMPEQLTKMLDSRLSSILGERKHNRVEWSRNCLKSLDAAFPIPEIDTVVTEAVNKRKSLAQALLEPADPSIRSLSGHHVRYHIAEVGKRISEKTSNISDAVFVKGIGRVIDRARSLSVSRINAGNAVSLAADDNELSGVASLAVPPEDGWELSLDYLGLSHDIWQQISKEFVTFLARMLCYSRKFSSVVTKDTSVLVRYDLDAFLSSVPTSLDAFWRQFAQSQAFIVYVETYHQKLFKLPTDKFAKTPSKDFWYLESEMSNLFEVRLVSEYDISIDSVLIDGLIDSQSSSTIDRQRFSSDAVSKIAMRQFVSPFGDDILDQAGKNFFDEQQERNKIAKEDRNFSQSTPSVFLRKATDSPIATNSSYRFSYKGFPRFQRSFFFDVGDAQARSSVVNDQDVSRSTIQQLSLETIDFYTRGSTCIYTIYFLLLCGNLVRQAEARTKKINFFQNRGENEKANDLSVEDTDKCQLGIEFMIEIVKRMKLKLVVGNRLIFFLLVQTCLRLRCELSCLQLLKILFDRFTSWGPWGLNQQSLAGFDVCIHTFGKEDDCKKLESLKRNIYFLAYHCDLTRASLTIDEANRDMEDLFSLPRSPVPFSQRKISKNLKMSSSRPSSKVEPSEDYENLKIELFKAFKEISSAPNDFASSDGRNINLAEVSAKAIPDSPKIIPLDDDDEWDECGRRSIYGEGPMQANELDGAKSRDPSSDRSGDAFVYNVMDADHFHIMLEEGLRGLSFIFNEISIQVDNDPRWQINSERADSSRPERLNVCSVCNRQWKLRNIIKGWNRQRESYRLSYQVRSTSDDADHELIRRSSSFDCFPKHCSAMSDPQIFVGICEKPSNASAIGPEQSTVSSIVSRDDKEWVKKSACFSLYSPWDLCSDILRMLNNESFPDLSWINLSSVLSSAGFRSKGERYAGLYWSLLYWLWVFELPIGFLVSNVPSDDARTNFE